MSVFNTNTVAFTFLKSKVKLTNHDSLAPVFSFSLSCDFFGVLYMFIVTAPIDYFCFSEIKALYIIEETIG